MRLLVLLSNGSSCRREKMKAIESHRDRMGDCMRKAVGRRGTWSELNRLMFEPNPWANSVPRSLRESPPLRTSGAHEHNVMRAQYMHMCALSILVLDLWLRTDHTSRATMPVHVALIQPACNCVLLDFFQNLLQSAPLV